MIHIKYCRKCKQPFDIQTNFDVCPKCREEILRCDKCRSLSIEYKCPKCEYKGP